MCVGVFVFYCLWIYLKCFRNLGARGSVVVKALCYKPEDRGFETRWGCVNLKKIT
jgi:hypothetical protein